MKKKKKEIHSDGKYADHEKKIWKLHNLKIFFDILQSGTFPTLIMLFLELGLLSIEKHN